MDAKEIQHKRNLLETHTRRLGKLEEQQARAGHSCEPKIDLEIEDIEQKISRLQSEINTAESQNRHQGQSCSPSSKSVQSACGATADAAIPVPRQSRSPSSKQAQVLREPKTWMFVGLFAIPLAEIMRILSGSTTGIIFAFLVGLIIRMLYELIFPTPAAI